MRFVIDGFPALREALLTICKELEGIPSETAFDCKLVVDELVTNVLRHGGGRAHLLVEKRENIRISVRGENGFRPPEKSVLSDVTAECGRGLYLVDALSLFRTYSDEDGITVVIGTPASS